MLGIYLGLNQALRSEQPTDIWKLQRHLDGPQRACLRCGAKLAKRYLQVEGVLQTVKAQHDVGRRARAVGGGQRRQLGNRRMDGRTLLDPEVDQRGPPPGLEPGNESFPAAASDIEHVAAPGADEPLQPTKLLEKPALGPRGRLLLGRAEPANDPWYLRREHVAVVAREEVGARTW